MTKARIYATLLTGIVSTLSHAQSVWDVFPEKKEITTKKYMVYMNPFRVAEQEDALIRKGYKRMEVPIVLNQKEKLNFIQQNLEALTFSPGKEDLKNEIFNELKINTPIKMMMTSSAFMAELTQQQALNLKNHKHIVTVNEIQDTPPKISGTLITKDYENSGEFINWAKPYTQTDDNITTNNRLY